VISVICAFKKNETSSKRRWNDISSVPESENISTIALTNNEFAVIPNKNEEKKKKND